jgi:hypothetical protein
MEGFMGLTRKRQRELTRLKEHAEDLWGDQKDVLEHASQVVREASRQAANYAREEVSPRVRDSLDHTVKPAVATGVAATKTAVSTTKERITDDFVPAVTSALGSALAVIEVAKDEKLREAFKTVSDAGDKVGKKVSDASDVVNKKVGSVSTSVSKKATKVGKKAAKAGAQAAKAGAKVGAKTGLVKQKSAGPGRYILIGVVVVAIAGIVYAAWQTLRADDDLWIDEDEALQDKDAVADTTI